MGGRVRDYVSPASCLRVGIWGRLRSRCDFANLDFQDFERRQLCERVAYHNGGVVDVARPYPATSTGGPGLAYRPRLRDGDWGVGRGGISSTGGEVGNHHPG